MDQITLLPPAEPIWDGGLPRDPETGDVYFSHHDPLGEREWVFIHNGRVRERLARCDRLVVGEIGMGSGLNALLTLQAFRLHARAGARLVYLTVEQRPWRLDDLRRLWQRWPELAALGEETLARNYPPSIPGIHRRRMLEGRVDFLFGWGEARQVLDEWDAGMGVDLWFLDGFAPNRNRSAWDADLFRRLAECSAKGAMFTTYTAAGWVRRGLTEAGFEVEKQRGFAGKRESCRGILARPPQSTMKAPWYARPRPSPSREAVIVGAGVAGCWTGFELALRGWRVRLLDAGSGPAQGASGNPRGLLQPRGVPRDRPWQLAQRLHWDAVSWAIHVLEDLGWKGEGLIQRLTPDQAERLSPLEWGRVVAGETLSRCLGLPVAGPALWWPRAGSVDPRWLCLRLTSHQSRITCRWRSLVTALQWDGDAWRLLGPAGEVLDTAEVVILANATAARHLRPELPVASLRGQLALIPADDVSSRLRCALCGPEGYLTPAYRGWHVLGASFERNRSEARLDVRVHQGLLEILPRLVGVKRNGAGLRGRVAVRAVTPDHLPLIGPLVDPSAFAEIYHDLRHGRPARQYPPAPLLPGLYVVSGLGAHGLSYAPWAAAWLADLLEGAAAGIGRGLQEAVHPARFQVRALKRGQTWLAN